MPNSWDSVKTANMTRVSYTDTGDFYIDLVFYNIKLKRYVLLELKTHSLTHADVGQLDMYVRMYDDLVKDDSDNPTIGILLCTETDKVMAKYSVLNGSEQLFLFSAMGHPILGGFGDNIE